jgi:hypothetical protein
LGFLCAIFAILLLTVAPGFAQTTSGTIVGTVTDASGGVIPATPVTLVNVATSTKTESMTDASGYYQFVNVQPGNYKVTISKQGFKALTSAAFKLEVEGSMRINLTLEVGSESQTVTVTAETPLIQAENTSIGSVVDERQTTELPLNGRNPMNLTALVPSVVPQGQSTGNTNAANPFAWGNYQIGGGMANQSSTYIDGSPVNTSYANLTALVPTQDSLGEFKVDTNDLTADYGHLAGGAIQFSTKSGSNAIHGAAWEYLRNKVLDANTWWNNYGNPNPTGTGRTPIARGAFSQNQFGANFGGPVFIPHVYDGHNKTFFFVNWEGFYLRQGASSTQTVPTAAEVAGDLSGIPQVNGVTPQIYDPLTTCLNPNGCTDSLHGTNYGDRLPIPNNDLTKAPVAKLNPVSQAYINKFYPVSKVGTNSGTSNFTGNYGIGGQNFETVAHVDHNFSDKQHLSVRYTWWKNTNLPQDPLGTGMCQDRCSEIFKVNNFVIGDTYTFNPTTILDLRLSYLRFEYNRVALLTSYKPSDIGQLVGDGSSTPEYPGPMMISIGTFDQQNTFGSGGGDSTIVNASDNDRIAGNLTKIMGKHTFKLGGEYLRATFNYSQSNNSEGQGSVGTPFTTNNHFKGESGTTGSALGQFLLGYVDNFGNGYNTVAPVTSELLYPAIFITDDWRISPKFTAHLGVRWENELPWTDRNNNISYFDPKAINPILAANSTKLAAQGLATLPLGSAEIVDSASRSKRNAQNTFDKMVSPRIGLTYAITPTTVISAGYGVLWIPIDVSFQTSPNNDPINSFATKPTTSINGNLTPVGGFDNPLGPTGKIIQPPKRSSDPVTGFQYVLLGQGNNVNSQTNPYPYAQQWNFGVQKQLTGSTVLDVAYAAARGTHLPWYGLSTSAIPESYVNPQTDQTLLAASVPNPFVGIINPNYGMGAATVTQRTLISPNPQYGAGEGIGSAALANSSYNSLQVKMQKRFTGGASIGLGYTYAKLISSTDTLTGWLESSSADNWGVVDPNNLKLEKSLSSNDVRNRLVVSYVYDIPVGRGKAILPNAGRIADEAIGGWGLEGITTFQTGYPVPIGTGTNSNNNFGLGQRPDLVPSCGGRTKQTSGATGADKLWFNVTCFAAAPTATFGTEGRNDNLIREPGIDNWDASIFKNFAVDKDGRMSVQFRTEFFNLFNRTQFGALDAGDTDSNFGKSTSQANNPRLVQFALRVKF